jgi:hypothetical protein
MRCAWCQQIAAAVVIGGCLSFHVFDFPFCANCEHIVQSAWCPMCKARIEETLTVPLWNLQPGYVSRESHAV